MIHRHPVGTFVGFATLAAGAVALSGCQENKRQADPTKIKAISDEYDANPNEFFLKYERKNREYEFALKGKRLSASQLDLETKQIRDIIYTSAAKFFLDNPVYQEALSMEDLVIIGLYSSIGFELNDALNDNKVEKERNIKVKNYLSKEEAVFLRDKINSILKKFPDELKYKTFNYGTYMETIYRGQEPYDPDIKDLTNGPQEIKHFMSTTTICDHAEGFASTTNNQIAPMYKGKGSVFFFTGDVEAYDISMVSLYSLNNNGAKEYLIPAGQTMNLKLKFAIPGCDQLRKNMYAVTMKP